MTETEWLECDDPQTMLVHLGKEASPRKLRLFACACCRLVWRWLPDEAQRYAVMAVEDHPDGKFEDMELHTNLIASSSGEHEWGNHSAYWAVKYLGRSYYKFSPFDCACVVAQIVEAKLAKEFGSGAEKPTLPALVRCIFGNPFRPAPVLFRPLTALSTRHTDGVSLQAQLVYFARQYQRLPEIGLNLEEEGCKDADVLRHCRGPGPHVRGCWVVDLILGKARIY